jgi:hypothetical protein
MMVCVFSNIMGKPIGDLGETHIHGIGVPNPSDLELKVDN